MDVTITPAADADLDRLKSIEDAADELFIERFRPAEWETACEAAERMANGGWILVARADGDVVGFVHVIQDAPGEQEAKGRIASDAAEAGHETGGNTAAEADEGDGPGQGIAYLDSLAVHPSYARRGIGRALVAAAQARAVEEGAHTVRLRTYVDVPWNAPFYASCGFTRAEAPGAWWDALVAKEEKMGIMQYGERIVMAWS